MSDIIKEKRKSTTIFNNKSGATITSAITRLIGEKDGYDFTYTSIVKENTKAVTLMLNLTPIYERAREVSLEDRLIIKIKKKYESCKVEVTEANELLFTITISDDEFVTSVKNTIKYLKGLSKYIKSFNSIAKYIDKLIDKKRERQRLAAERKAAKKAIEKEVVESIPGAQVASDEVMGIE